MPTAEELEKFKNRSDGTARAAIPKLKMEQLPTKLRQIDPIGCEAWEKQQQMNFDKFIEALNLLVPTT